MVQPCIIQLQLFFCHVTTTCYNLLNNYAKHLEFLKVKITTSASIVRGTYTFRQQFLEKVRNRLQLLSFERTQLLLCDNSVVEWCQNNFDSEYLFYTYLEENMNIELFSFVQGANKAMPDETAVSMEECLDVMGGGRDDQARWQGGSIPFDAVNKLTTSIQSLCVAISLQLDKAISLSGPAFWL